MMITPNSTGAPAPSAQHMADGRKRVFKMVPGDDRIAGSIPVWEAPETARDGVTGNLAAAGQRSDGSFAGALSYTTPPPDADAPQEFGFGDLIDMVNPLQHIPVVSTLYRDITGDQIKPISRIIGGTIYGGPVGAAASVANVVVEEETGKDIAGNVVALVTNGETPHYRSLSNNPAQRLAEVMPGEGGGEGAEALSPHFSAFTSGWRGNTFIESPGAAAAAAPKTRYEYND